MRLLYVFEPHIHFLYVYTYVYDCVPLNPFRVAAVSETMYGTVCTRTCNGREFDFRRIHRIRTSCTHLFIFYIHIYMRGNCIIIVITLQCTVAFPPFLLPARLRVVYALRTKGSPVSLYNVTDPPPSSSICRYACGDMKTWSFFRLYNWHYIQVFGLYTLTHFSVVYNRYGCSPDILYLCANPQRSIFGKQCVFLFDGMK